MKDQTLALTLEQEPLVQGALLCLDPKTGYVRAMVGGRDFSESQFNRATHSRRQPGSAFKPFIYAAALEKGYTPSTILMDSPVEYSDPDGGTYWAPKNYDKSSRDPLLSGTPWPILEMSSPSKSLKTSGWVTPLNSSKNWGLNLRLKGTSLLPWAPRGFPCWR